MKNKTPTGGPRRAVPQRTCVGCRETLNKRQLLRLVRRVDGAVALDPTGKANGRGAYLHDRRACWVKALTSRALDHALKITLTDAQRAELQALGAQYDNDD